MKKKSIFIIFLVIGLLLPFSSIPMIDASPGWLNGWDKRVKITLDSGDVDDALSNFPNLIYLSDSCGINNEDLTFVFDEVGANRKKIAVTQSDGTTECYVEVEKWDLGNEKAWLWTKVPSIASDVDTDIYLYFDNDHADNDAYVGDPSDAVTHNVWDANFKLVTHMRDDPDNAHIRDSTVNANDGTKEGPNEPIVTVNGMIDDAQDFDALNDYIDLGSFNPAGDSNKQVTLSLWFKGATGGTYMLTKYDFGIANGKSFTFGVDTASFSTIISDDGTTGAGHFKFYKDEVDYTDDTWRLFTITFDGNLADDAAATRRLRMFVNGARIDDGTITKTNDDDITILFNSAAQILLGAREQNNVVRDFTEGIKDDVRISSTARTSAWIKASYESGRDHLVDFGSVETVPVNDSCTITDMDDTDNLYAQISGGYTIDYDGHDNEGYTDINYILVNLTQGATVRVSFKYTNSTNTFSIIDGDTEFTLDGSSSAARSGNNVNLTIVFHVQWDATEEADLEIKCYIIDSGGLSDTDTMQTDYCDVATNLLCSSIEGDDANDPDRVDISDSVTIVFGVRYANDPASGTVTTFYPPDAEFTSVSIYDSSNNNEGTDNTIVNGDGSVAVTVPATVGSDTYNIFIDMVDADYDDGEETPTETIVTDRIVVYWEQLNDTRVDVGASIRWRIRAVLDYDDHVVGAGDSLGSTWGALTWDAGNTWWYIDRSEATVIGKTIDLNTGSEITYGISSFSENITETTGIFDRIIILTLEVNNTAPDVDEYVLINCTAELEYDHHALGAADQLNLTASVFPPMTWNAGLSVYEEEEVRADNAVVTYNAITGNEATHGITVVNMDGNTITVSWGVVNTFLTVYFHTGIAALYTNTTLRTNGTEVHYILNEVANVTSTVDSGCTFFKYLYDTTPTLDNPLFITMDANYTCSAYAISPGGGWNVLTLVAIFLVSVIMIGMKKKW